MDEIGYWITDLKDEKFCAPQEVVRHLDTDVREKIALYLEVIGDCFAYHMGHSWCRFFCGIPQTKMGNQLLHDGHWLWPEGLSHYVRFHGITLPDEFVRHVLGRIDRGEVDLYNPPPHPDPEMVSDANAARLLELIAASRPLPMSQDFWIDWCATRRSPRFLERLRQARIEAEQRDLDPVGAAASDEIAREVARFGLSERPCQTCKEPSLQGIGLCARHYVSKYRFRITPELMTESFT